MADPKTIKELARIPRGIHGQLHIDLVEPDGTSERQIEIRLWFKKDGSDAWQPSKNGVSVRASEVMQVGLALRRGFDALSSGSASRAAPRSTERLAPRCPTAVLSQPASTRTPSDVTPGPDDPNYDWSQHL